jgi:hypothetical protein
MRYCSKNEINFLKLIKFRLLIGQSSIFLKLDKNFLITYLAPADMTGHVCSVQNSVIVP